MSDRIDVPDDAHETPESVDAERIEVARIEAALEARKGSLSASALEARLVAEKIDVAVTLTATST